ncbi:MAG: hypothetical protein EON92_20840 [Burkholderiales bacterium]|nr:MAG: hypothetical protein EON92_20840 [Burkholderiales bacterium]
MALLKAARTAQTLLVAEFVASFNDTAVDALTGATKAFGTTIAENLVFDVINLPPGAVIVGGELIVETAGVGPTAYTAKLDTVDGTAILAATSLLVAARTAITGLGLAANAGSNVRLTMASTVAVATAGKFRVRINYTIDRRATEVQPS